MAALILGCGALLTEKIQKRRKAKKENQRELQENFEQLKANNAERQARIKMNYSPPPSYEDVTKTSSHRGSTSSTYSHDFATGGRYYAGRPVQT